MGAADTGLSDDNTLAAMTAIANGAQAFERILIILPKGQSYTSPVTMPDTEAQNRFNGFLNGTSYWHYQKPLKRLGPIRKQSLTRPAKAAAVNGVRAAIFESTLYRIPIGSLATDL